MSEQPNYAGAARQQLEPAAADAVRAYAAKTRADADRWIEWRGGRAHQWSGA
ncbi:hypothetical protein [Streptomyces sp. NBC_01334]|uniref:hypothetical protein n=1 Tax=Streptomyces sp. NBC_01334 TaxID=2903827 RepID=UPI002E1598E3|nr:hypothetical protein OG736_00695 [Streptomyces sp. NBC_01334]